MPGRGAEDVLVLPDGRVLTGVDDGRVIAPTPDGRGTRFVGGTGDPLGLEWHPDGWVVVCDAQRGVLRLDPDTGEVSGLVAATTGLPSASARTRRSRPTAPSSSPTPPRASASSTGAPTCSSTPTEAGCPD